MSLRLLLTITLTVHALDAQVPDAAARSGGATVSGVVHDSIAGTPLAGAVVQLAPTDSLAGGGQSAVSDAAGRFEFTAVAAGRYALGFLHPMLDSLGLEPPVREIVVGDGAVRADLAIPSAATLRLTICGPPSGPLPAAVVVGIVRDASSHQPVAGITVIGEWIEFTITDSSVVRRVPQLVTTTASNGWFAFCGVPSAGWVALRAARGTDSTDRVEVEMAPSRLLRSELFIGSAAGGAEGTGRLSGTVVSALGGRPVSGALVSISGGPESLANERGQWSITSAPAGTRTLEVRAVGYHPDRQVVNVVTDAAPIRTTLRTLKSVLDTIRITATRQNSDNLRGFDERQRSGFGRYLTLEEISRRRPNFTSDLFRTMPGLRVDRTPMGESQITMRGIIAERCSPAVYLDGRYMSVLSAEGIDDWINPDDIAGIEVYTGFAVPPQFSTGMAGVGRAAEGCGSIVIWSLVRVGSRRASLKQSVLAIVFVTAFAYIIEWQFGRN